MKSWVAWIVVGGFLIPGLFAQEEQIQDFTLSKKEKEELEKIEKIKEEFKKKYPDWVDTGDEGEFIDYRLGKSIEKRKSNYIKQQRALLKRIEEEKKRKAEEERKEKLEAERKKKELEEKRKRFAQTPLGTAVELLKEKRYQEAYDAFYALFLENTTDARINFYLGLAASGVKNYDDAVSAFERVLIVEPNHTRARLELARSLFFLKLYEQAEAEFQKVLESGDVPPEVLEKVKKFMVAIEDTKIRNHYNAAVMFGVQYDTNINNDVGQNNYVIDPDVIPGGVKGNNPVSDGIHQEMANLNHIYDFGKLGDYFMQNSFTVFSQNYLENDENNILFYSLSTGIAAVQETYSMGVKLHYDNIQIDAKDFMNVLGLEAKYSQPLTDRLIGEGKLKHQQKTFPDNSDNDSSFNELSLSGKQQLKESKDYYSGSLLYSTESSDAAIIERNIIGLSIGYSKLFDAKQTLTGTLGYKMIGYAQETLDQNLKMAKREDNQLKLTVQHLYKLDKKKVITGSLSYIDNASTHAAFDYDKMLAGANMMWLF